MTPRNMYNQYILLWKCGKLLLGTCHTLFLCTRFDLVDPEELGPVNSYKEVNSS